MLLYCHFSTDRLTLYADPFSLRNFEAWRIVASTEANSQHAMKYLSSENFLFVILCFISIGFLLIGFEVLPITGY